MNSYECYIDYLALKKHFTTENYEYHKYNGKVKASVRAFEARPDRYYFEKISKSDISPHFLLLSNLSKNPNAWIKDIANDNGKATYNKWKKINDGLFYTFRTDISNIFFDRNPLDLFKVPQNQYPEIVNKYVSNELTLETFTILCVITNAFTYWNANVIDKTVFPKLILIPRKYQYFINLDTTRYKEEIKKYMKEI